MKVTLGMILAGGFPVPAPFLISYSALLQTLLTGSGNAILPPSRRITASRVLFGQDFPIDWARNRLVQLFLEKDDGDYLLFLDTDMTHPPDLVHRLVAHDVDLVTAKYQTRLPPHWTVAMVKVGEGHTHYNTVDKQPEPVQGLMRVDAGGAGALLMSRRLLTAIRKRVGADDWFRYQDSDTGLRNRSEDMWFYEQARACGFQPWLDADLQCGHVAQQVIDGRDSAPYVRAWKEGQLGPKEAMAV